MIAGTSPGSAEAFPGNAGRRLNRAMLLYRAGGARGGGAGR